MVTKWHLRAERYRNRLKNPNKTNNIKILNESDEDFEEKKAEIIKKSLAISEGTEGDSEDTLK